MGTPVVLIPGALTGIGRTGDVCSRRWQNCALVACNSEIGIKADAL